MNLQFRLEALEADFMDTTLPVQEAMKWYAMFMEDRGTGHTTESRTFTREEWNWYRENEANALETLSQMQRRERHRKGK